ncbi:hypothetical protein [Neosynechococcus sphagnicola]|uniref:hypothetical protein n=1 Tax=Neosynechococcus sphagnicola TaxID=1501145 RepID=UPI000A76FD49|nr:hypothetical protein [Neosynechococcus sphagnicola]
MVIEIFPFSLDINTTAIAGASLWSLALYVGFSPIGQWVTERLDRWFNFAERSLYTSAEEFEKTRRGRESQNAFSASVLSIVPFFAGRESVSLWGRSQSRQQLGGEFRTVSLHELWHL